MAGLWETDNVSISPLANAQYPAFGTNEWQFIFVRNNLASDGDVHIDLAVDASGTGTTANNTGSAPIVAEVLNATTAQLDELKARRGERAKTRGVFRFHTEDLGERHWELHPVTELLAWDGSGFAPGNDYRSNIDFVADGTSHTATQLAGIFDGSQTMTATVMADDDHVIFDYPSPSINYVQYEGVAESGLLNDSVSPYFWFRPDLVPSATVRCRIVTNTLAATAASNLLSSQSITVNAMTRTDMLSVSNAIAALSANQSLTFQRPVELITLSVLGTGTVVTLPVIRDVQVTNITPTTATVLWTTDVASDSRLIYGLSPSALTNVVSLADNATFHSMTLSGLQIDATYYFHVLSSSAAGTTTDDNNDEH